MSDVNDLVTWLRAQLDEDERVARAATTGPWRHDPTKHWRKPGTAWFEEAVFSGPGGIDAVCVAGTGETDDPQSMADADHIARHDPIRVLAEVEAKRRIIARHCMLEVFGTEVCAYCATLQGQRPGDGYWPCPEILDAALPYAALPGYREEWRP